MNKLMIIQRECSEELMIRKQNENLHNNHILRYYKILLLKYKTLKFYGTV